ncbi:MAG: hypothetical protein JWQ09_2635 [Segetibacter sp.]|nr:hypothetical protein [Segetibacter sp.]
MKQIDPIPQKKRDRLSSPTIGNTPVEPNPAKPGNLCKLLNIYIGIKKACLDSRLHKINKSTLYPIAEHGFGQNGVEQKAPIERNYRRFVFGAFRLLHLMLAVVKVISYIKLS